MKTLVIALAFLAFLVPSFAQAASVMEEQQAIQKMRDDTLSRLYAAKPETRDEISKAVGYAVFSSGSLAIIWVSGGYGHGIAHNNDAAADTYMQVANAGVGLGLGAKDFNTVFVFHDKKSFNDFITTGLDLSGNADVAAKEGAKGAAASGTADVLPGVRVYQLTKTGLMAQAMLQGTKYWQDDSLNGK